MLNSGQYTEFSWEESMVILYGCLIFALLGAVIGAGVFGGDALEDRKPLLPACRRGALVGLVIGCVVGGALGAAILRLPGL
jgi:presenilin-like A22 family membrane protease